MISQIASAVRQRQKVPGLTVTAAGLRAWFDTPNGQNVLEQQRRVIDQSLSCLFGYHLLQLSALPGVKLYENSRIVHCCRMSFDSENPADLASEFESLPLADESVDVTLVHHALDFSENPHQLLNEVSRATIPNGHIVIVGFDPVSLNGMIKPFAQLLSSNPLWKRHSLRQNRLNDWLKLLGFEALETHTGYCHVPLCQRIRNGFGGRAKLRYGHFYCVIARKSVASIRPIKPAWDAQLLHGVRGVKIAPRPITARGAARLSLIRNVGSDGAGPEHDPRTRRD